MTAFDIFFAAYIVILAGIIGWGIRRGARK